LIFGLRRSSGLSSAHSPMYINREVVLTHFPFLRFGVDSFVKVGYRENPPLRGFFSRYIQQETAVFSAFRVVLGVVLGHGCISRVSNRL